MLQNMVSRKMFGCKRAEVAEGWRKLRNEELPGLFIKYYGDHIKVDEANGACGTYGREQIYVQ